MAICNLRLHQIKKLDIMQLTNSEIFIATFLALINGFLALRLGSTIYNS